MNNITKRSILKYISRKAVSEKYLYCSRGVFFNRKPELKQHLEFILKRIEVVQNATTINVVGVIDELKLLGIKTNFFDCIVNKRITHYITINRVQRRNQEQFRTSLLALSNLIKYYLKYEM